jgi:HAD superfamily hydrolase (TIGR01509 family)
MKGVIFDVDGTLVDSNDAHAAAWVQALLEGGHPVTFPRVRPLIGMGGDKLLPALTGVSAESPEGKAMEKRRGEIFRTRFLPKLRPFPGARELVAALKERGLKLAVASSASKDDLAALLQVTGVAELFEEKTSSDDAERSKPDPDIVAAALKRLGCAPSEAVMIGDTPYDVEAAGRVGVACIALRCGGWDDRSLAGAAAIYDGPAHLLGQVDASPIAA